MFGDQFFWHGIPIIEICPRGGGVLKKNTYGGCWFNEDVSPEASFPKPKKMTRADSCRCFLKRIDVGVSENSGTPKSSIVIGFSIINHPFLGFSPYFWKHPCED